MPGKHNAGGCGCCGNNSSCWSCDSPTDITVTAPSGTCCASFGGTFVFLDDADLAFQLCQQQWSVTRPYQITKTTTPGTSGSCIGTYCALSAAANTVGADIPYTCLCDSYLAGNPYCRTIWLILALVNYKAEVRDVAGSPTLTVTLTHTYTEITWVKGVTDCEEGVRRTWTATDVYESIIDCNDASTVITHESRTLLDNNGNSIDPTSITWGYFNEKSYTLCAAPTVTLNI